MYNRILRFSKATRSGTYIPGDDRGSLWRFGKCRYARGVDNIRARARTHHTAATRTENIFRIKRRSKDERLQGIPKEAPEGEQSEWSRTGRSVLFPFEKSNRVDLEKISCRQSEEGSLSAKL